MKWVHESHFNKYFCLFCLTNDAGRPLERNSQKCNGPKSLVAEEHVKKNAMYCWTENNVHKLFQNLMNRKKITLTCLKDTGFLKHYSISQSFHTTFICSPSYSETIEKMIKHRGYQSPLSLSPSQSDHSSSWRRRNMHFLGGLGGGA